jgi:hypothetical protein
VSNALAIAGVTAVLMDLLDNGLIDRSVPTGVGAGVTVSALAPDLIQVGNDAAPRLNLFMHQVTLNAAWRNVGYPTLDYSGQRISNAPLALDLHYLLTAYGSAELQAELLLGYAMQLLHETPVLARGAIRKVLNAPSPVDGNLLPPIYRALQASVLADQIEQIKITPTTMNTEELSKLWTAIQSHYRPSAAYQVTVVLIESNAAVRSPLPVLTRGAVDPATQRERGIAVQASLVPPYPEIESIKLPNSRISALGGEVIELAGHDLDGSGHALQLFNPGLNIQRTVTPPTATTASAVQFNLPVDLPAGAWVAALQLLHGNDSKPRSTNQLALSIAPQITVLPASAAPGADRNLILKPQCAPALQPTQRVSLILGGIEVLAAPFAEWTSPSQPTFTFRALPAGIYQARLRVDGVDSPFIDRTASPPKFSGPKIEVLP